MTTDLAKTSGAELLALLARHFARHPDDPWALLRNDNGTLPRFPRWKVPVADFLQDDELDLEDIIKGPRQKLAGGWTYTFLAHRGDAYFEIVEGPEREGPFGLDEVLDQFFNNPNSDVREALEVGEVGLSPNDGYDFRYEGVSLFEPGNLNALPWFTVADGDEPFDDAAAISELIRQAGNVLTRMPHAHETVRPLFEHSPVPADEWEAEGQLYVDWQTTYFVPVERYTSTDEVWSYTRHELSQRTLLEGPTTGDLATQIWRYPLMRDLAAPLAEVLERKPVRQFFAPVYEAVLLEDSR